jgi:putative oxidoreductase
MAMTDVAADKPSPPLALMERAVGLLDGVPYTLLALPLRAAAATVFWNSAQAKLANWDTTIELFTDDYKVPLLPPEIAANMALGIELTAPVLLVLGLLTRAAALVLLGMTAVIEIFVYPQAWPTTSNGLRSCWCCCAAAPASCRSTMYYGDACAAGSAQKRKRRDVGTMQLFSTITCPACGHRRMEEMPEDACRFFYDCTACGVRIKPKPGDCCVFCSYGDVPCPPVQAARENGDQPACCRQDRGS